MSRDRAHVMLLEVDPLDGLVALSCFCGWTSESFWEDREDAEAEYRRHREAMTVAEPHGGTRTDV